MEHLGYNFYREYGAYNTQNRGKKASKKFIGSDGTDGTLGTPAPQNGLTCVCNVWLGQWQTLQQKERFFTDNLHTA